MKAIRDVYRKQATLALEQGNFAHVAVRAKDLLALLEDADELESLRAWALAVAKLDHAPAR